MIKTIVVAKAKNNAIGRENDLLWRLPDDFQFFKKVTLGHVVIMGRKTFDSLPGMLPDRTFVIITRQKDYEAPKGHFVAHSLEEAFELCKVKLQLKQVFIIGGGVIYREALNRNMVDRMLITEVDAAFEDADTFFPDFDKDQWKEERRQHHPKDERHAYSFDYVSYVRDTDSF